VRAALIAWLAERSERERHLLAAAAAATALVLALQAGAMLTRDLAQARARVESQRRELATVRRLADAIERSRRATAQASASPLVTRLETATLAVVGRERLASMTPVAGAPDAVAVRLVGASLDETVRVLHAVEDGGVQVEKVELIKHPDDPARFDVLLEVAGNGTS
jgi:type II secretory pathway component PulM